MAKVNTSVSIEQDTISIVDEYANNYLSGNRSLAIEIIVREWAEMKKQRAKLDAFIDNLPDKLPQAA